MLQEDIAPAQQQYSRKSVPIKPTLVIGLGDYGRAVGEQLAARLMLTEESLREVGLTGQLLVQKENGIAVPGLVRIMHLDWQHWFDENFHPDALLQDIGIPDPITAESGTPPRKREEERHSDDWVEARQALSHPRSQNALFDTASLPLRTHDNPMRVGNFQIQGRSQNFEMRVVVICALREAASAELGIDIIESLGKTYVKLAEVAKGIHIFCYVGGTSWEEHAQAHLNAFGEELTDTTEFDSLLAAELARILPTSKRTSMPQPQNDNFLDKLDQLWHKQQPQTIESCYLIDSQLANRVATVQHRQDEPDEVVIATALAVNLFITGNADRAVRQEQASRWDMSVPLGEPGLFSTLGIAAYSLDHPRLRRHVYNYVVGVFLEKAQPRMAGDSPTTMLIGDSQERLLNENLETELSLEVQQLASAYKKQVKLKIIKEQASLPSKRPIQTNIDYKNAIRRLSNLLPVDIYTIQNELEAILAAPVSDSQAMETEFMKYMKDREQAYQAQLANAFQRYYTQMFSEDKAPLTRLYRFAKKSLETLSDEAYAAQAPSAQMDKDNIEDEQQQFTQQEAEVSAHRLYERTRAIRREIQRKPDIVAITSRVLLLSPVLILLVVILATLFQAVLHPFFNAFNNAFQRLLPSLYALPLLPFWAICLLTTVCLWLALFLAYHWYYRYRLRRHLQWLATHYEAILEKVDKEGWRWALTKQQMQQETNKHHLERLCQPQGTISKLRDNLLAEKFIVQNRVLERIFFDERLQVGLKDVSMRLAANGKLWAQRGSILRELVDRTNPKDTQELEQWLRERAGEVHKDDTSLIVDLVESFLVYQTAQRLEEIWHDLSTASALFLQRTTALQDDPVVNVEMFGVHNQEVLYELEIILQHADVNLLHSVDRLRWIFMHVQTGLELLNIKFSVESQLP